MKTKRFHISSLFIVFVVFVNQWSVSAFQNHKLNSGTLSPYFINAAKGDSITITDQDIEKEMKFGIAARIVIPVVSFGGGLFVGYGIGGTIGGTDSAVRGSLLTAAISPLLIYELTEKAKRFKAHKALFKKYSGYQIIDTSNKKLGIELKFGIVYTNLNEYDIDRALGLSFGIARNYYITKHFNLTWDILYANRRFNLADQRILSSRAPLIYHSDITYSVSSIDVGLYPGLNAVISNDKYVNLAIGFSISVPINNRSKFIVKSEEDLEHNSNHELYNHDFSHVDEIYAIRTYFNFGLALKFGIKDILFEVRYKKSIHRNHLIKQIENDLKLTNLTMLIGVRL